MPRQEIGGGTNSRPLNDTIGQSGPGAPDDAVGPEQRTIGEQLDLSGGPEADAIARKLAQEAGDWRAASRGGEDLAPEDDPTGHA